MKNYKNMLLTILLAVICVMGAKQEVYAAKSGYVSLKVPVYADKTKTYKKYDVTGDGVADEIKLSVIPGDESKYDYSWTLKIMVNGLTVYEYKESESLGWNVGLVYLKNGKIFFDIKSIIVNDYIALHKLYEYKNGTLESVYDFKDCGASYSRYYSKSIYKVVGNTIYTNTTAQFCTIGGFLSYNAKLKYTKGQIKPVSNQYSLKYDGEFMMNRWTANRTIKIYNKPAGKKVIYTLKKGEVIKINKVIYKNNKIYFGIKLKNGKGKTGYIPGTKNPPRKLYFKESQYSG